MSKSKENTPVKVTPEPKVPLGAVRPVVELTPNIRLTESFKPSTDGFTKSFEKALGQNGHQKK